MDAATLRLLILGDASAKALAEAGNDTACAARCSEIAPMESRTFFASDRTLYAELGAEIAETILGKMAAANNPILTRVLGWLRPQGGGIDLGHANTRAMIQQLAMAKLFSDEEAEALLSLGKQRAAVSAADVGMALAGDRADGKAGPLGTP